MELLAPDACQHSQDHHRSVARQQHEEEQVCPKVSILVTATTITRLSRHQRRQSEEHGSYKTTTTTTTVGRHAFHRCYGYLALSAS